MARGVTANLLAEIAKASLRAVVFIEADFNGDTVRVWTGTGSKLWDGYTWQGGGRMLSISPIRETTDLSAEGIQIGLSGIDATLLADVLTLSQQGRAVKVWIGALNDDFAIVSDPYLSFSGRLNVPEIAEDGETATITISAESRLIDLNRNRERRYTAEDQKSEYPTDLGFDYMASLQEQPIQWGGSNIPRGSGGAGNAFAGDGSAHGRGLTSNLTFNGDAGWLTEGETITPTNPVNG